MMHDVSTMEQGHETTFVDDAGSADKRLPAIRVSLDACDKGVAALSCLLADLETDLTACVRAPEDKEKKNQDHPLTVPTATGVPLADELAVVSNTVTALVARVADLRSRLEL